MRRLGLACAALIVLPACSGEPTPIEPKATASESGAASSATTETTSVPRVPPYVAEISLRGRAAFAGYWIHLLNYSVATGTTRHLEAVSSPACSGCNNYLDQIEKDRRNGVRSDGFQWTPVSAAPGETNDVLVGVEARAYVRASKAGTSVEVRSAQYEVGFELERHGSKWRTRELYLPK